MKVFLVIWLVASGVDHGGPPIEMPSMEVCQQEAQALLAKDLPDGADYIVAGCTQMKKPDAGKGT